MGKFTTHSLLIVLCAVLTVILAFLLSVTILFLPQASAADASVADPPAYTTPLEHHIPASAETDAIQTIALNNRQENEITNLILIGTDKKEDTGSSRADCILLCTFHHNTKAITMTSILRDLYVPIPGHGSNRINAAYAFGGASLLKQTMEENFGLSIDGCVEVDFSNFPRIIDLLGGVTLELRQDEADRINRSVPGNLTEGIQPLSGQQALAYTRIRKLDADGDFSRTRRQRKVIRSLMEGYRETDPLHAVSIAARVIPMLTIDMEYTRVIDLLLNILPIIKENKITSQYLPAEGMYQYETVRGMSVLTADMNALKEYLNDTISGNT